MLQDSSAKTIAALFGLLVLTWDSHAVPLESPPSSTATSSIKTSAVSAGLASTSSSTAPAPITLTNPVPMQTAALTVNLVKRGTTAAAYPPASTQAPTTLSTRLCSEALATKEWKLIQRIFVLTYPNSTAVPVFSYNTFYPIKWAFQAPENLNTSSPRLARINRVMAHSIDTPGASDIFARTVPAVPLTLGSLQFYPSGSVNALTPLDATTALSGHYCWRLNVDIDGLTETAGFDGKGCDIDSNPWLLQ